MVTLYMPYETVLARADVDMDYAFSDAEARTAFAVETSPIVVLDLMLPDGDDVYHRRERHGQEGLCACDT